MKNADFNIDHDYVANYNSGIVSYGKGNFSKENFSLTAEGGKNLFHYLKGFNIFKEPEVLILYPNSHFYYDENDLKYVRTLINLRKINLIKDPDTFLQTLIGILPANVNFIGCFSAGKTLMENGFLSEFSTKFNNFLDSRTYNILYRKSVSDRLEKHGFKVIDMTEVSDLTFYYSKMSINLSRL